MISNFVSYFRKNIIRCSFWIFLTLALFWEAFTPSGESYRNWANGKISGLFSPETFLDSLAWFAVLCGISALSFMTASFQKELFWKSEQKPEE